MGSALTPLLLEAAYGASAWKRPVRVLADASVTPLGTQTVDGIDLAPGDRVLLVGQGNLAHNGIFVCAAGAWPRATDASSNVGEIRQVSAQMRVAVTDGSHASEVWRLTTPVTTVGISPQVWAKDNDPVANDLLASATPEATPDTLVLRDGQAAARFGWLSVGVNSLTIGSVRLPALGSVYFATEDEPTIVLGGVRAEESGFIGIGGIVNDAPGVRLRCSTSGQVEIRYADVTTHVMSASLVTFGAKIALPDVEPTVSGQVSTDADGNLLVFVDGYVRTVVTDQTVQESVGTEEATDVIMLLGTSAIAGGGASTDNATGPREYLWQALRENRSKFIFVGPHGYGADGGMGTTWGKLQRSESYYDPTAPPPVGDWRHHGEVGRLLTSVYTVTGVNAGTDVISAFNHDLQDGLMFVIDSTGTVPGGLDDTTVYFARDVVPGVSFKASLQDGGTVVDITSTGSGTISIGTGLTQLVSKTAGTLSRQPTTIIVQAGADDVAGLVSLADPDPAGVTATRMTALLDALDVAYPTVERVLVSSVFRHYSPAPDFAAVATQIDMFNAWLWANVPLRSRKYAFVDGAAGVSAAEIGTDGIELTRIGSRIFASNLASGYRRATLDVVRGRRVPRGFVRRKRQPVLDVTAVTNGVSIPDQASIRVAGDNAVWAIWYRPTAMSAGTNVIFQQNSTYTDGFMVAQGGAEGKNLSVYLRSGAPVIPASDYTAVLKANTWARIMLVVDHDVDEVGLFVNGHLVQRVKFADNTISTQQALLIGTAGGVDAAIGQYAGLLVAHGDGITMDDAIEIAEADYRDGVDPPSTTAAYPLNEGSGTSVAGLVGGAVAGTVTGATWAAVGVYPRPVDDAPASYADVGSATIGDLLTLAPALASFATLVELPSAVPTATGRFGRSASGRLLSFVNGGSKVMPTRSDVYTTVTWTKVFADGGDGTETPEFYFGMSPPIESDLVAISFLPLGDPICLVADDNHYATLTVSKSDVLNGLQTVSSITTKTVSGFGTGDWASREAVSFPINDTVTEGGSGLSFQILKSGLGVTVVPGVLVLYFLPRIT